jgi:hypothetical protein
MALNPTVKRKWIKALRSGDYKQGIWYLEKTGKFCCLGVLADIQGCPFPELNMIAVNHVPEGYAAGLSRVAQEKLATMNDGGSSFSKIADYIKEHY